MFGIKDDTKDFVPKCMIPFKNQYFVNILSAHKNNSVMTYVQNSQKPVTEKQGGVEKLKPIENRVYYNRGKLNNKAQPSFKISSH